MATTIDTFRHHLNPLHIMCRLIDFGFKGEIARRIAHWYEIHVYNKTRLGR